MAWLALWAVLQAQAQVDSVALRYAAWITMEGLRQDLDTLASDRYEGREVGSRGEKLAAAYLIGQLKAAGIPPVPKQFASGLMEDGYRQQFPVVLTRPGGLRMAVNGHAATFGKDYFYFADRFQDDLATEQVMLLTDLTLGGTKLGGSSSVVLYWPQKGLPTRTEEINKLGQVVSGTGASMLLLVHDSFNHIVHEGAAPVQEGRMHLGTPDEVNKRTGGLQMILVSPAFAGRLVSVAGLPTRKALKKAAKQRVMLRVPLEFTYSNISEQLTGENVLGFVEGSDLKGQVVVVTAHYDHVGIKDGEVYNGADDDGSGTVAVLAMARAFAKAREEGHGPRRSMLFMAVSGEEKGLFGSRWYTDHPVFPLDSTIANLNIDMIGRVDELYNDTVPYVYVIGSNRISSQLGALVEEQNALYTKLELDYRYDADNDPNRFYYRSDHYNFAKHGIPVAFFFNGTHEDYHGPYDEVDKIHFGLLRQRALLVFHVAWALGQQEVPPLPDLLVPGGR